MLLQIINDNSIISRDLIRLGYISREEYKTIIDKFHARLDLTTLGKVNIDLLDKIAIIDYIQTRDKIKLDIPVKPLIQEITLKEKILGYISLSLLIGLNALIVMLVFYFIKGLP